MPSVYYQTAVDLREMATKARENYPLALQAADEKGTLEAKLHPDNLIKQAVGFEIAAALYCLAQAVEDLTEQSRDAANVVWHMRSEAPPVGE